jgi:hypothetical protein
MLSVSSNFTRSLAFNCRRDIKNDWKQLCTSSNKNIGCPGTLNHELIT